ncbi:MAG: hypothetical protein AB7V42_14915 [Thermoleophilia bacterium]
MDAGSASPLVVHERTLLGAIDAHLGALSHNSPWLVDPRGEALDAMAREWLGDAGRNWLPDVPAGWVRRHLDRFDGEERELRARAVDDFLAWAEEQGLIARARLPYGVAAQG